MAEAAPKFEKRKTIYDLIDDVSHEYNGNFIDTCDRVFDRNNITKDFEKRLELKRKIGKLWRERKVDKTKKDDEKIRREIEEMLRRETPEQAHERFVESMKKQKAYERKKIEEEMPLFADQADENNGLSKIREK